MKNIIIYSSFFYPHIGGLENYVFDLATELSKLKYNVTVVAENTDNYKDYEEINGFKVYRIPTFIVSFGKKGKTQFPKLNLKFWEMKKTINMTKYDLMITNTRFFSINILGLYLLTPNVNNIIHIEHGSDYVEFKNRILNILSISYDKICFLLLKKKIKDFYGVSERVIEFMKRNKIQSKGLMRAGLQIKEFENKEEIKRKFNVEFAINGALGGLVAITANCHAVTSISALIIGAIGGLITIVSSSILIKFKIDDAVGAIPVHLGAGIWGTIAVAIFGKADLLGTGLNFKEQLKIQLIGIASIGSWTFLTSFSFLYLLNKIMKIRVRPEEEEIGLNYAEHGAKTEGYELLKTIQLQATTGNLKHRVKEEPFSELGVIAHYYNKALDEIEKNVVAKSDYLQILDNIGEGLLLLNEDFTVSPAYSKHLETILEEKNLENKNLLDVLQKHISEKIFKNIKDYLELCFDINVKENVLRNINPLERIEFFFFNEKENHSKFLSFKIIRIIEEEKIKRLMLIIKDETQTVILEKEKEKNQIQTQSEMELIYKILHIDYEIFYDFVLDLKKKIVTINTILEKNDFETIKENIDLIYRYMHTIKGNARLLELNFIYNKIHKIEDIIQDIKNKPNLTTDDFVPLIIELSELHALSKKLDTLIERLKKFNTDDSRTKEKTIYSIKKFVENLSKEHNKKISLITDRFNIEIIPKSLRKILNDILIQLVKNSIVHGIEEDRTKKGKNEYGIIELITSEDDNNFYVSVRDDGQGINYEKIKEKAIKRNLIKPDDNIAREKLIEFIFLKNFSTMENTNLDAGRGVGLDIVYEWIKKLNGKIVIKNETGQFCEFNLIIPKKKEIL